MSNSMKLHTYTEKSDRQQEREKIWSEIKCKTVVTEGDDKK